MTIVLTGGGSGGHITPLLAVASEIKTRNIDTHIVYIGQRGDRFAHIVAEHYAIDDVRYIFAGKFRRYHGEGWRQLLDIKTMALNIRDMVYIVLGCFQSLWLLWRLRPRTVFTRGGFVSVPVGLAAAMLRVSYTTHDSDAIPSLANKLIARWATAHAVALPKETYTSYPQDKTITVGVPVAAEYSRVTAAKQQVYRKTIGLDKAKEIVFVTGGGLGAQIINEAMVSSAKELLAQRKQLYIVHLTGHAHAEVVGAAYDTAIKDSSQRTRVVVKDFVDNLYAYSGAADVVVMRAGATNIAEMAAQAKPCVIVPNPKLTGGHQIKNAAAFAQAAAAVVVDEGVLRRDHMVLAHEISNVLDDPQRARALGAALHEFAHHDAAARLTDLILMLATKGEL